MWSPIFLQILDGVVQYNCASGCCNNLSADIYIQSVSVIKLLKSSQRNGGVMRIWVEGAPRCLGRDAEGIKGRYGEGCLIWLVGLEHRKLHSRVWDGAPEQFFCGIWESKSHMKHIIHEIFQVIMLLYAVMSPGSGLLWGCTFENEEFRSMITESIILCKFTYRHRC